MNVTKNVTMNCATYPSLRDRVVFISGGSSGIGAELVRAFAQQGSRVAFCGTKADGGAALTAELVAAGGHAPWYAACDVRDAHAYQALLRRVIDEVGPVRVLVNNAGRDDRHAMEDVTPEMWDERLALNLKHYFFAIQAVAPAMAAAGGGSIINMGSVSWMRGRPHLVGYTTAKAGILGTRCAQYPRQRVGARSHRHRPPKRAAPRPGRRPAIPGRAVPEDSPGPRPRRPAHAVSGR